MTKGSFGERLRREREMRGVSLEEIAAATRIGPRFLKALENEQWDRLPGGVFNRGFVRSVAHFLGMDEESLIAEYTLATDDRAATAPRVGSVKSDFTVNWSRAVPLLVGLALVVLLLLAGWFAWHKLAPRLSPGRDAVSSTPQAVAPVSSEAPPRGPEEPSGASTLPSDAGATPSATAPLLLRVEAGFATQVTVVADGQRVFNAPMAAGEKQDFRAQDRFEVSAGDSTALFLVLNGQTIPPIGSPGKPGKITLTHQDLKKGAGGVN